MLLLLNLVLVLVVVLLLLLSTAGKRSPTVPHALLSTRISGTALLDKACMHSATQCSSEQGVSAKDGLQSAHSAHCAHMCCYV
jgi:hypothetical protein